MIVDFNSPNAWRRRLMVVGVDSLFAFDFLISAKCQEYLWRFFQHRKTNEMKKYGFGCCYP